MPLGGLAPAGIDLSPQPPHAPVAAPEPGEEPPVESEVESIVRPDADPPPPVAPALAVPLGVVHGVRDAERDSGSAGRLAVVEYVFLGHGPGLPVGGTLLLEVDEIRLIGNRDLGLEVLQGPDIFWADARLLELTPVERTVIVGETEKGPQAFQMDGIQLLPGHGLHVRVPVGAVVRPRIPEASYRAHTSPLIGHYAKICGICGSAPYIRSGASMPMRLRVEARTVLAG